MDEKQGGMAQGLIGEDAIFPELRVDGRRPVDSVAWRCLNLVRWSELREARYD